MKQLKIWTYLSLLVLLLTVGCNSENMTEPAVTAPGSNETTTSEPVTPEATSIPETAVPLPTTELTQTIRLTPVATPQIEIVPTLDDTAVIGEVPEAIMTAVYNDLTTTLNVSQAAITVTRAESTVWNDGSLGCPQPGEVYTQATVPGYWIVLQANGRSYDYHAAESGYFILCQNNLPSLPPITGTPTS